MNDLKQEHQCLQDPNHVHHPYWRHAHRDWRVWVGVTVMLAIMLLYVMRGALAWPRRGQNQQTVTGAATE